MADSFGLAQIFVFSLITLHFKIKPVSHRASDALLQASSGVVTLC